MTASSVQAQRMLKAHDRTLAVLREHASAESNERLDRLVRDKSRPSAKNPQAVYTYHAEMIASLAEIVDDQAKANAPRPRGRPRRASL